MADQELDFKDVPVAQELDFDKVPSLNVGPRGKPSFNINPGTEGLLPAAAQMGLPIAGAALGSLAGPSGSMAGAGLGSAVAGRLAQYFPNRFSETGTPPSEQDQGANILGNTALEGGNSILNSLIKKGIKPAVAEFLSTKFAQSIPGVNKATQNALTASRNEEVEKAVQEGIGSLRDLSNKTPSEGSRYTTRILPSTESAVPNGSTELSSTPFVRQAPGPTTGRTPLWAGREGPVIPPETAPRTPLYAQGATVEPSPTPNPSNAIPVKAPITPGPSTPYKPSGEQKAVNDLLDKYSSGGKLKDTDKLRNALRDPELSVEKGGPLTQSTRDNLNDIADLQDKLVKQKEEDPNLKSILYTSKAGVILGSFGFGHAAGEVAGGLILGNEALGYLASRPGISKLMIEASKLPPESAKAKLIRQGIMYSLRGTEQTMIDAEGEKHRVQISDQGVPQIPR